MYTTFSIDPIYVGWYALEVDDQEDVKCILSEICSSI